MHEGASIGDRITCKIICLPMEVDGLKSMGKRSKNLSYLCVKRMLEELEIPLLITKSSNLLNCLQSYTMLFLHLLFLE
jgi:hypothetical protein